MKVQNMDSVLELGGGALEMIQSNHPFSQRVVK